ACGIAVNQQTAAAVAGDHVARADRSPADGVVADATRNKHTISIAEVRYAAGIGADVVALYHVGVAVVKNSDSAVLVARDDIAAAESGATDDIARSTIGNLHSISVDG